MPFPCSLLLEVFDTAPIYDGYDDDVVLWEISTDATHPTPYLLAPKQYAPQEIDPIACTATIGTVEVGVIDVAEVPGDQTTGWMTARVHDVFGRRCRLSRWIDDTIGWMTIADGPASAPKMDPSYSAYRWTIRDTRDTERKLALFQDGGSTSIMPRGIIAGFGSYTDDTGVHQLVAPVVPLQGVYNLSDLGDGSGRQVGQVSFGGHFTGVLPTVLDDARFIIDSVGESLIQVNELTADQWGCLTADILWRIAGAGRWNLARPVTPAAYRIALCNVGDVEFESQTVRAVAGVLLFFDTVVPDAFVGLTNGEDIEIVVRSRAPASTDYPVCVEGPLGDVLSDAYNGILSRAPTIPGSLYDPAGLQQNALQTRIRFDPDSMARLVEPVILYVTQPIDDGRTWTETILYAPTGWIPTLDADLRISPLSRNRPDVIDFDTPISNAVTVPSSDWQAGDATVSDIIYTYPRYYIPNAFAGVTVDAYGIAQRPIEVDYDDPDSELRYGSQPQTYDASAFAAIGTPDGLHLPGQLETAGLLAQIARFEVLDRYRAGAPTIAVSVRRSWIALLRVGQWIPWNLSWLPDTFTGLRGSMVDAAQVLSIQDDNCIWRTVTLEGGFLSAGAPGYVSSFTVIGDVLSPGDASAFFVWSDISDTDKLTESGIIKYTEAGISKEIE